MIDDVLGRLSAEEVIDRLETAGIAYSRMNSMPEFLEHPQLTARSRWTEIGSEVGPLRALRPPVEIEGVEPVMGDVPALGQHTSSILEELGVDRDTIAAWKSAGTI